MGITEVLTKVKAKRVCGLDASTKSLAFAIMEGETPIQCGEIHFQGSTPFERLKDARRKVRALVSAGTFNGVDFIAIESAIMVRNVQVAIDLAYVYGVIIGELSDVCKELHKVAPISWQSYYGVPNLKTDEKAKLREDFPGKSNTWYQNKGRQIRKQRILDHSKTYFTVPGDSDNVGDAIGIAYYATNKLTR